MHLPRSSGILLHITSLPSPFGIGDLGPSAYTFADFLHKTGQSVWQVLPLVPVGHGYSPYSSPSTFAGNPLLISPETLRDWGLLFAEDFTGAPKFREDRVDYATVIPFKMKLLQRAYERFEQGAASHLGPEFNRYCEEQSWWLDDYALFMSLKDVHGTDNWTSWPKPLLHREAGALAEVRAKYSRQVRTHAFWQFLFSKQWYYLKHYCNEHNIQIFGDLPIYVAHDSADVWANQNLFYLDDDGNPKVVAGVPPDYFSATGQRWGNPLYKWDLMKRDDYEWWTRRLSALFNQVDLLRLDHFRGFEAYWEIPASEPTAVNGQWVDGPGADLFHTVHHRIGRLPLIAEDLGLITQGVRDLMKDFHFPGMAVLHFAFAEEARSSYLPHNYQRNIVAYTGTHDNDTTLGWWQNEIASKNLKSLEYTRKYLQLTPEREREIHWEMIRLVFASVANLAVVPLQDVLGLGSEARMNIPGVGENNWSWRFTQNMITTDFATRLYDLTNLFGRRAGYPSHP